MQKYKIRGADGKDYGPVDAEVVRQWIMQRRVASTTMVQMEDSSDWKPLASFPELSFGLTEGQVPPISAVPIAEVVSVSGQVQTSKLAIASLVCGLLGFLCLPGLAGLILGITSLARIKNSKGQLRGQGLAIAGICVSAVMLLLISIPIGAGLFLPGFAKAKGRVMQINCTSNLKQIALAARLYAGDHKGVFPKDFLSMSNELSSPKILFCPADQDHTRATNWAQFDPRQNVTYEFLHPRIEESTAMSKVIFRCPIHDNVAMGDGSARMGRGAR